MRRKHAAALESGAAEVARLEGKASNAVACLGGAWRRYADVHAENDLLRRELAALHAAQVRTAAILAVMTCLHL
jgi:hypothetical protein